MKNLQGYISAIVVLEQVERDVIGVTVFPDTEEGKRDSEIFFFQLVKENDCDMLDEEIETCIKEGKFVEGDYMISSVLSC